MTFQLKGDVKKSYWFLMRRNFAHQTMVCLIVESYENYVLSRSLFIGVRGCKLTGRYRVHHLTSLPGLGSKGALS